MESVHKTTSRITDSVALYLPANVNNDTAVQYQDFETGMAGFLALGGKGVLDQVLNNSYSDAAGKFMGMGATMLVEMLKKVGQRVDWSKPQGPSPKVAPSAPGSNPKKPPLLRQNDSGTMAFIITKSLSIGT